MSDKLTITDRLIIFFSFVLCIFHTFTFIQAYYSFIVTLGLFCIILFLYLYKCKGRIIISSSIGWRLAFVYTGVILIVFVSVLIKGNPIVSALGAYLPIAIWPTLYIIVTPVLKGKTKRQYIYTFLCFFAVSVVATLSVVVVDNDAARLLAGAASDAVRNEYYMAGVGGYGFVYGSVFVVYTLLLYDPQQRCQTTRVLLRLLAIVTCVMIVFASYTAALLMLLISLLIFAYTRAKSREATIFSVLIIVFIVLSINPILHFLYETAKNMDLYWISNRIGQLINADTSGGFYRLKRVQLYMRSLNSFFSNPFVGAGDVGGHSMVFDTLGNYGIWGLPLIISIFTWFRAMMKKTRKREGLVYLLAMALLVVNTLDTIVFIPLSLFVMPVMLSLDYARRPVL